jgi:ATP-dependent Clp protease adaptor protein ClpS
MAGIALSKSGMHDHMGVELDPVWSLHLVLSLSAHPDVSARGTMTLTDPDHNNSSAWPPARAGLGRVVGAGSGSGGGGRKGGEDEGVGIATKTKSRTKRPSLYRVLLLNDDYTPMEFVVHVLQRFFNKGREDATRIMLHVHQHGVGECGVFTYEIAETKVTQVMDFARKHQHPLQCVMEKK